MDEALGFIQQCHTLVGMPFGLRLVLTRTVLECLTCRTTTPKTLVDVLVGGRLLGKALDFFFVGRLAVLLDLLTWSSHTRRTAP